MGSEFGKGLCYNLGLFLCHSERDYLMTVSDIEKGIINNKPSLWFYGASDHLFELEIPKSLSVILQRRLRRFKSRVLGWRLPMHKKGNATEVDRQWAIQEAKDLLRAIDTFHKVKTIKGEFE